MSEIFVGSEHCSGTIQVPMLKWEFFIIPNPFFKGSQLGKADLNESAPDILRLIRQASHLSSEMMFKLIESKQFRSGSHYL